MGAPTYDRATITTPDGRKVEIGKGAASDSRPLTRPRGSSSASFTVEVDPEEWAKLAALLKPLADRYQPWGVELWWRSYLGRSLPDVRR